MRSSSSTVTLPGVSHRCDRCSGPLVEIVISLVPEGSMAMRSCSTCDTRYWRCDGQVTDLTGALGTMASGGLSTRRKASSVPASV